MKSIETTPTPVSDLDAAQQASDEHPRAPGSEGDDPTQPHYLVVLHFQDGRSADLVVPGVTGMGGSGDAVGPGRLSIYGPAEGGIPAARRLIGARVFNDLAASRS